jgi:hypothetical protein
MDPLDEDFLVGLAITGRRTPQSASEMDRLVQLEQEAPQGETEPVHSFVQGGVALSTPRSPLF